MRHWPERIKRSVRQGERTSQGAKETTKEAHRALVEAIKAIKGPEKADDSNATSTDTQ